MFHNKALGAAIAMALSLGVNSTEAATFQVCLRDSQLPSYTPSTFATATHCFNAASPLTYAYEQFGSTINTTLNYPFRARYTVTSNLGTNYDFYVTFTLSNGATWATAMTSANFTFSDTAGVALGTASSPKISIVNHGATTDSDVSYLISSKGVGITTAQILNFEFQVANAQLALKSAGGQIALTINSRAALTAVPTAGADIDTSITTTLATSTEGADIQMAGPTDGTKAYISVFSDGMLFEGSGKQSTTQVYYGSIKLIAKTTPPLDKTNTLAPTGVLVGPISLNSGLTAATWNAGGNLQKGKLTIDNGNFNASGDPSTGKVYIDKSDGNTSLVNATSFSTDKSTAVWEFNAASLGSIFGQARNIVLNVDGKTSIIENRKTPPKATLYVEYVGGAGVTPRTAVLRHLKKNGSVCTLYNIPPPTGSQDTLNIRITNDSATVTGFVKGTLRDYTGKEIFKGKFLVEPGKLVPHQTVHLDMTALTAGGVSWDKRAVLTVESNIPEPNMQVFGFLRNTGSKPGFPESPLMNMSTGATGNGCD